MYKEEKIKVTEKLTLKVASTTTAYNMLQDMRQLIILDFRPTEEFQSSRIRKSIQSSLESYYAYLCIALKSDKFKTHFEHDDFKRVLFVFPKADWKKYEQQISKEIA